MARVNLPPLKIPQKILQDKESRDYFDRLNFIIYQLWQRTGGGSDNFEELQDQIDVNIINIGINTGDIAELQETFSWKIVPVDEIVTIGINQQMIVADGIKVEGSLVIDGELSLI